MSHYRWNPGVITNHDPLDTPQMRAFLGIDTTCSRCNNMPINKDWLSIHQEMHKMMDHMSKELTELYRRDKMSQVMWCDPGNHAVKADVPGSARYMIEQVVEDSPEFREDTYGRSNPVKRLDQFACPEHNPANAMKQVSATSE